MTEASQSPDGSGEVEVEVSISGLETVLSASALAVGTAVEGARNARRAVGVLSGLVPAVPLPAPLQPRIWLESLERRSAPHRAWIGAEIARWLDAFVPAVVEELLQRIDLTAVVLGHVDLDRVVAQVDVDAAAARVNVDGIVARVDLDAAARALDVDAVAHRLDLDVVLDRLDLTAIVLDRVDIDALLREVLSRLDIVGLVEEVMDAIDLPMIIQESTGSIATESVRGARMQGIVADQAVGRAVDRLFPRRKHRHPEAPVPAAPVEAGRW